MARKLVLDVALSLAAVAVTSFAIGGILAVWPIASLQMLYILPILWLAGSRGRMAPLLASAAAFLAFDWFFLPPFHTLDLEQPQEWLSLGIFLIVALVTGQAYALQRRQAIAAAEHDRRTELLYKLSTETTVAADLGSKFEPMLEALADGLALGGLRLYVWRDGQRQLAGGVDASQHGAPLPIDGIYHLPVKIGVQELAELEVYGQAGGEPLGPDDLRVLQGFANLLANALER